MSHQEQAEDILQEMAALFLEECRDHHVTLSMSKAISKDLRKITFTPVRMQEQQKVKVVRLTNTQDFTSIIPNESVLTTLQEWTLHFLYADYSGITMDISLRQSKKGKVSKIVHRKGGDTTTNAIKDHNKQKKTYIDPSAKYLTLLGLADQQGHILAHANKKFRQINKFVEIIDHHTSAYPIQSIADMGSGKGYLTFALYDYLRRSHKSIKVTGYELREDLVKISNDVANRCLLNDGLHFSVGNINSVDIGHIDMLIALHACDTATDMAIDQGLRAQAKYMVLSPCCHKQIRKAMTITDTITKYGIYQERTAEMVTDTLRALILESQGYKVDIFEWIYEAHTAKNTMLFASYTGDKKDNVDAINAIKTKYGIDHHYLETLVAS